MKFSLLVLIFIILVSGCNRRHPPKTMDPDLVYDSIPIYDANSSLAPYNYDKFKPVLDKSRLQIYKDNPNTQNTQDSNNTTVEPGDFNEKKFPQFYADINANLHFTITKKPNTYKVRSELKEQLDTWSTSDNVGHYWVATLRCLKPKTGITSYTWMQIHGTKDSYNNPLLRLLWERDRQGLYDHIWAIIIISDPDTPKIYEYVDLGERPNDYFTAEVYVKNNMMDIIINRQVKRSINVTYWEKVQNYYKAGVYINRYGDGGTVSAIFKELHFYDYEPPNVVSVHH